jgi:hypothetical protein
MKNNVFSRELDRLVERRMKKLSGINLREELEFRENISALTRPEGREVFEE